MPSIAIEVRREYTPDEEVALMEAVHAALVEAFRVSPVHRNVTLTVHKASRFLGRLDCPDPERLTNISIFVLPGRSVDAKRRLYQGIVKALLPFGIPTRFGRSRMKRPSSGTCPSMPAFGRRSRCSTSSMQ